MNRICIAMLLLFSLSTKVWAIKITAINTGNWSLGSTWSGGVIPNGTDSVVIQAGKIVTINNALTFCGVLQIYGILKFSATTPILVANGNLTIMSGGEFRPYKNIFAVNGSFINNGITDLSQAGTIMRMGTPNPAVATSISGSGVFTSGVIYTLRIDNSSNVNLSVPLSVSNTLALWRGVFNNGDNLILDNTNLGTNTTAISAVKLIRQQESSLANSYTLPTASILDIEYTKNLSSSTQLITAGYEIPPSKVFNSLLINNSGGVYFNNDIALNSSVEALKLVSGIISVASGKTIMCKSTLYKGTEGTINSFVSGALSLTVSTTAADSVVYPLGIGNQNRKIVIKGLKHNDTSGESRVRFSVLSVAGGTDPSGFTLANSVRWLGTEMSNGTKVVFTGIGLNFGPNDNCTINGRVMQSSSTTGTFTTLSLGTNTSKSINAEAGNYVLKCFALGEPVVSYTNTISIISTPSSFKQYKKSEWNLGVSTSLTNINPYNDSLIELNMILTTPSSQQLVLPCFYVSDKGLAVSKWKARFAPQDTGVYTYKFQFKKNGTVINTTSNAQFTASIANSGDNGILHYVSGDPRILTYDSGKKFRGIGNNIGWENRDDEANPTYTYDYFLPKLATKGCNFFRTFMNNYNLPIEWNNVELEHKNSRYKNSSDTYNPDGLKRMDELVTLAENNNLHVMLMIEWQCNLRPDVNWDYNPYNIVNGGPATTPGDFFINAEAKRMFKSRLRYMIARWGYSPSIGMWELMNEIDNALYKTQTDGQGNTTFTDERLIPDSYAVAWHTEMSTYLKENDPYKHIITTSIGFRTVAGLWSVPNIDINQEHMYNYTDKIPSRLTDRFTGYNRPTVIGEFARDYTNPSLARWDIFNFDFKKGLWFGLFGPTPVLPINWFWGLWETQNGFDYYNSVKEINQRMLDAGQGIISPIITTSTDTTILTKGVNCGAKYFVHILHKQFSGNTIANVNIGTTVLANKSYLVQVYNPETNTFAYYNNLQLSYTSSSTGILSFSFTNLAPQKQIILILTDLNPSNNQMSFNVASENYSVKLDWNINNQAKRTEIERSSDGVNFKSIYSAEIGKNVFYDEAPINGNNYYRLTQYTNTGDLIVQGLKTVKFQNVFVSKLLGENVINVQLIGYSGKRINTEIIDLSGQIIYKGVLPVTNSGLQLTLQKSITPGIYVIRLKGDGLDVSRKFIY